MRNAASSRRWFRAGGLAVTGLLLLATGYAQQADVPQVGKTSYMPVSIQKDFADTMKEMSAAKSSLGVACFDSRCVRARVRRTLLPRWTWHDVGLAR